MISENAQDVITISTLEGMTCYISPSVQTLLGYTPEEILGKPATDFWHPEDIAAVVDSDIFSKSDIFVFECRIRHKMGCYFWFETTAKAIRNDKGEIQRVVGVGRDVTKRKIAETELMRTKERLESFFKNNADAIWMVDLQDKILEVNTTFETMFGWKTHEVIGKPLPIFPERLAESMKQLHNRVRAGESIKGFETIRQRKGGETFHVSATLSPVRNANGNIIGISGTCRDITEWKKSHEIIQQSEKLSVAGQLAAGIADEIRNPITSIKGFLQLIQTGYGQKKEYLEIMTSEIERIEIILGELLILA